MRRAGAKIETGHVQELQHRPWGDRGEEERGCRVEGACVNLRLWNPVTRQPHARTATWGGGWPHRP